MMLGVLCNHSLGWLKLSIHKKKKKKNQISKNIYIYFWKQISKKVNNDVGGFSSLITNVIKELQNLGRVSCLHYVL